VNPYSAARAAGARTTSLGIPSPGDIKEIQFYGPRTAG
jgi:hypothetical protein